MCLATHSLGVLPVSGDASRRFTGVYVTGGRMKSTGELLDALGMAGSLHNPFRGAVQPAVDQTTHMRQRRRRYGDVAREWGFQALSICVRGAAPTLGLGALAGCAGLPAAEPWSKADVGREIAFGALLAVDWAQTREIA